MGPESELNPVYYVQSHGQRVRSTENGSAKHTNNSQHACGQDEICTTTLYRRASVEGVELVCSD